MVQDRGVGCLCRETRMPLFLFHSTLFWSHLERSQSLHTDPSGAKSPGQQSRGGELQKPFRSPAPELAAAFLPCLVCSGALDLGGQIQESQGAARDWVDSGALGRLPGKSKPFLGLLFQPG